jgi:hypothetical protein
MRTAYLLVANHLMFLEPRQNNWRMVVLPVRIELLSSKRGMTLEVADNLDWLSRWFRHDDWMRCSQEGQCDDTWSVASTFPGPWEDIDKVRLTVNKCNVFRNSEA